MEGPCSPNGDLLGAVHVNTARYEMAAKAQIRPLVDCGVKEIVGVCVLMVSVDLESSIAESKAGRQYHFDLKVPRLTRILALRSSSFSSAPGS